MITMSANMFSLLNDFGINNDSDNSDDSNEVKKWITVINNSETNNNQKYNTESNQSIEFIEINNFLNKKKIKPKKENHKKLLCKNVILCKVCKYGSKCLYAHNLNEQKLDEIRDKAYKIIKGDIDASKINIHLDRDLYKVLLLLGDVCPGCKENNCTGGYNCKHGCCDSKYIICGSDINNGTCEGNCGKIHLTDRGLKPYFSYIMDFQKKKSIMSIQKANVGTLLTTEFFKKIKDNKNDDSDDYLTDDSYDSDDNESNIDFDTSIFKIKFE
jgi:hypothetical protein